MKKNLLFITFVFICGSIMAQVTKESIDSKVLNAKQSITIKLPKNYIENSNLAYPVIVVLNGDYLFDPVIGQTDFQTYFGIVPESIIVGVNKGTNKFSNTVTNEASNLAWTSDDTLSKFVSEELLPFVDGKYHTNKFRVIVGHQKSTNVLNSFLLKDQSPFQAYISISPQFPSDMSQKIVKKLELLNNDIVYYMATTTNDLDSVITNVISTSKDLNGINNKHLKFYFDNFDGLSHHTMVMSAIARGFQKVFDNYKPIKDKQINNNVVSYENTMD
jgi:predicted alpha/beta superfamily hydrolase